MVKSYLEVCTVCSVGDNAREILEILNYEPQLLASAHHQSTFRYYL